MKVPRDKAINSGGPAISLEDAAADPAGALGKGSYWTLDASAFDMFEQGNYRRRRTRRQRQSKIENVRVLLFPTPPTHKKQFNSIIYSSAPKDSIPYPRMTSHPLDGCGERDFQAAAAAAQPSSASFDYLRQFDPAAVALLGFAQTLTALDLFKLQRQLQQSFMLNSMGGGGQEIGQGGGDSVRFGETVQTPGVDKVAPRMMLMRRGSELNFEGHLSDSERNRGEDDECYDSGYLMEKQNFPSPLGLDKFKSDCGDRKASAVMVASDDNDDGDLVGQQRDGQEEMIESPQTAMMACSSPSFAASSSAAAAATNTSFTIEHLIGRRT